MGRMFPLVPWFLAAYALADSDDTAGTIAALASDEQCLEGEQCTLSALQLRSTETSVSTDVDIEAAAGGQKMQEAVRVDEVTGEFSLANVSWGRHSTRWQAYIEDTDCQSGHHWHPISCERIGDLRVFSFPAGEFSIDKQVNVPANTHIVGIANPNNMMDPTRKPDYKTITTFVAAHGVTHSDAKYCHGMAQGDAQKVRIGFLMNSNTKVSKVAFQGKDTKRPNENGSLCGGGLIETPGCVSPGYSEGPGGPAHRFNPHTKGCYDAQGNRNDLITGDGKGVSGVEISDVRMNDLDLHDLPKVPGPAYFRGKAASQLAVWVAMTVDGSATTNVKVTRLVSMMTLADGINFHGNVQDSEVSDSYIGNTGDDAYALWGSYLGDAKGIVFKNSVAANPGVLRDYMYALCWATYGLKEVTFEDMTCYDIRHNWRKDGHNGNPMCLGNKFWFCNAAGGYFHSGYFGAYYPEGYKINLRGNKYLYIDNGEPINDPDRPMYRHDNDLTLSM